LIPLRDNIPSVRTPVVNYALLALCALAFVGQLVDQGDGRADWIERYGMVPARVLDPGQPIVAEQLVRQGPGLPPVVQRFQLGEPGFHPWLTFLTSIFLHGGFMHFLGNMLFLYIFGDNVEDRLGHVGYLIFYLLAGLGASMGHLVFNAGSPIPTIGASGAIAGVMGAYFVLYPRARIVTLVPIFIVLQMMTLPAVVFLGLWFLMQFTGVLGAQAGVAWWAHIGGFVIGAAVGWFLRQRPGPRPPSSPRIVAVPSDRWERPS